MDAKKQHPSYESDYKNCHNQSLEGVMMKMQIPPTCPFNHKDIENFSKYDKGGQNKRYVKWHISCRNVNSKFHHW